MVCKKCGSKKVQIETINKGMKEVSLLRKILRFTLIFCTLGIWAFVPKPIGKFKINKIAICQNCGKSWNIK